MPPKTETGIARVQAATACSRTCSLQVLSSPDSEAASREAAAAPEAGSGTPAESPIEVASVSTCGRQASSWLRMRPDIVLFGVQITFEALNVAFLVCCCFRHYGSGSVFVDPNRGDSHWEGSKSHKNSQLLNICLLNMGILGIFQKISKSNRI